MPKAFFNPHNLGGDFLDLENDLRLGTPTAVFGVNLPFKSLLAACCTEGRVVYVTDNAQTASRAAAAMTSGSLPKSCTAAGRSFGESSSSSRVLSPRMVRPLALAISPTT